ncbi:MAG: Sapep family Mn(2+)-dependent dipeptidase, partial [Raoultibacter sp.]
MGTEELSTAIDSYIDDVWEQVVEDITTLVRIPSTEDLDNATPEAPYGAGPAEALKAGVALAEKLGFDAHNCDGHIAYADLAGASETQIGIIGHLDVVPAGSGWNYEPFDVTRKEGYLIGRGVLDDKGPSVVAMYAMHFFKDQGIELPYTLRMIMGANEESGMRDVTYYREHYADPAFIFTPDADFPVCYGEKGGFDGCYTSKAMGSDAKIVEFKGGNATNAVPS